MSVLGPSRLSLPATDQGAALLTYLLDQGHGTLITRENGGDSCWDLQRLTLVGGGLGLGVCVKSLSRLGLPRKGWTWLISILLTASPLTRASESFQAHSLSLLQSQRGSLHFGSLATKGVGFLPSPSLPW